MKDFFYFGSLRKSIIQFLDIFNDMRIAKYNEKGDVVKYVSVPIKFMPKQKFYTWLYQRTHAKHLPVIGVEVTGIEYDSQRTTGKYEKINVSTTDNETSYQQTPIPYNISFDMRVATEYMNEMDQIAEQILPFFSPSVSSRVESDSINMGWDMNVKFESCNIEQEIEVDTMRSLEWLFSFTAETYLLQPVSDIKTIRKVVNKIYTSKDKWESRDTTTDTPSGGGSEDSEVLVIGDKEDGEIITRYEVYNNE